MSDTPSLKMPYILPSQAQKHVTHNEALDIVDALVQLTVLDRDLTAPPATPAEGDRYIVKTGASGAWAGMADRIAVYRDGGWIFFPPKTGWTAWVIDEACAVYWAGSAWRTVVGPDIANLAKLGILTNADATNRLAVKSDAILFSHDDVTPGTGGTQVKLNKAAAGGDAGLVFQTGYSARALLGLLGSDDLTLKVSANGSSFTPVFSVAAATGVVNDLSVGSAFQIRDTADPTKVATFSLSGFPTATSRAMTLPNVSGQLATLGALGQTFTGATTFNGSFLVAAVNGTFGSATGATTYNIASGATITGQTKAVNIGISGAAGSTTTIVVGPVATGSFGTTTFHTPTVTFSSRVAAISAGSAALTASMVGVGGATPDSMNRLSITSPQALFSHAGAGMQTSISKAAAANDASIALQDNGSTRAVIGLLGDDNLTIRTSADGTTFATAATIDRTTGKASFARGVQPPAWPMRSLLGAGGLRIGPMGRLDNADFAVAANTLFIVPVMVPYDFGATVLSIRVTTAAAGNARLGLYADQYGGPSALIVDAGTVSTASTGLKELAIAQNLRAGVHWLGAVFSATPGVNGQAATASTAMGTLSTSAVSGGVTGYSRSFAYAALPADESAAAYAASGAANIPCILLG